MLFKENQNYQKRHFYLLLMMDILIIMHLHFLF